MTARATWQKGLSGESHTVPRPTASADDLRTGCAIVCMLRFLERMATRFNAAGIPLLALKGAALNLTIHDRPDRRPMADLDLMIRPEHVDASLALLEELGYRRGRPLLREDFFPRFHYETELIGGRIFPVRVDLHVRPFRPLRYARLVPLEAFWQGAHEVRVGRARVLVPSIEDMLIHLAAHSAIHANQRAVWLRDIKQWADAWRTRMDWKSFQSHVVAWGLTLPVRQGLEQAEKAFGQVCPEQIRRSLAAARVGWRERLALRQAPRDAGCPLGHVLVNASCTPGWRFVLLYLRAALIPDGRHMAEWYDRRHWGWLPCAHVLRLLSPVLRRIPGLWDRLSKIEVRESSTPGPGVFATRVIRAGERIAPHAGADPALAHGKRPIPAGKLKYLHHSCRPNAKLVGAELRALRVIDIGEEITRDYGESACNCRQPDAPAMCA